MQENLNNTCLLGCYCARYLHLYTSWQQGEKPAAQIAHLGFADTQAKAKKTKRAIF